MILKKSFFTFKEIDPRPNWEPYNVWPGAYGSVSVGGGDLFNPKKSTYSKFLHESFLQENKMYEKFSEEVSPKHARYKHLVPMGKNDYGEYFPALGFQKSDKVNNGFTTNFTERIAGLNKKRMLRLMQAESIYPYYSYTILSVVKCGAVPIYKPLKEWHRKQTGQSAESRDYSG